MAKKKRTKRKGPRPRTQAPASRGLGILTVRLDPALLDALRRAAVERRIAGEQPWSQQEIVQEALREWIEELGYEV